MTTRGANAAGVSLVTSRMRGAFRNNAVTRGEFLSMVGVRPTNI
jgi:GTP cyclohydrolase I